MTRGPQTVFYSDHPEVVGWWEDVAAQRESARGSLQAIEERLGADEWRVVAVPSTSWEMRVVGVRNMSRPQEEPPERGWRLNQRKRVWIPDKRTSEGKELDRIFNESTIKPGVLKGMPESVRHDGVWCFPGIHFLDGKVWVTWGCPKDAINGEWSQEDLDLDIWTQGKLSEYHALLEGVKA